MKSAADSELKYLASRGAHLPPFLIDFAQLDLPMVVSLAMRRALEAELGHNTADTQSKCFAALKEFSNFLHEAGIATLAPLPADTIHQFADWLERSTRGPSAQVYLRNVIKILQWCLRNVEGAVAAKTTFLVRPIRELGAGTVRESLGEDDIKRILDACYEDIETVEQQRSEAKRIMSGNTKSEWEAQLHQLLSELLEIGRGSLPTQLVVNRAGHSFARRIEEFGGHRVLNSFAWISPRGVLPFYLAILVQTSANPRALLTMTREPVINHPLRSDLERLCWMKWRAKSQQYADFPVGRKWSAPSIARRLIVLNEELVPRCKRAYKNSLFISHPPQSRTVKIPSPSTWTGELQDFIERHGLPAFTFKEVRRAGAQLIRAASGSDKQPKQRLNHKSDKTIRVYTHTQRLADEFDQTISAHQIQLVESSAASIRQQSTTVVGEILPEVPVEGAETIFGFRCKNPFAGVAPGSTKGKACQQFFRCADCAGAITPLDDFEVVATLLAASIALEDAKTRSLIEGWWPRYERLYESTRIILSNDLIPSVHPAVIERAKLLVSTRLIPFLE